MTIDLAKLRAETLALIEERYLGPRETLLAADKLRLLDEIERLKRALVEAAIPLEAMILAAQDERTGRRLYGELWDGVVAGAKAARAALAEGGPDDR